MKTYQVSDVKPVTLLKEAFGEEVTLDDGADSEPYRVLKEFELDGRLYAVLQSDAMKREEELALFRIISDEQGELQLETVEDDEEWETVLELYDEMTVSFE
ncbi:DUF1292 domain-containing protein [Gorillibacterium sp. sgz5001074]|uniref:DUF1292 domain-containing protein n=1 Tax=Gorillibacterium sp. sgz5001074 TaxID=3446695 RepID=UPI003F67344C